MRNRTKQALAAFGAATIGIGALGSATAQVSPPAKAQTPYNILFITSDQQQYMPFYPEGTHYEAQKLLAELGTTFEKHYVCANMSTSSRSVIYTGQHITQTRMIDNTDFLWQSPLDEDMVTLGDRLSAAGYYPAYMGKWHMGDASLFSDTPSTLTSLDAYGFGDWNQNADKTGNMWEGFADDPVTAADAIAWLTQVGTAKNEAGQPFFLAVNFVNPHDIMYFNNDTDFIPGRIQVGGTPDDPLYQATYDAAVPVTWDQNLKDGSLPPAVAHFKAQWEKSVGAITTQEGWTAFRNYYFNCIQDMDNHLMELLNTLAELDMMDNTIILFTADHGEYAGAHGLKGKGGTVFDENIHVPMVIVHPDFAGGQSVNAVTSHIDLVPTMMRMAGATADDLPGGNMMELVSGQSDAIREGALYLFEMISMTMDERTVDAAGTPHRAFNMDNRGFIRCAITEQYKFGRYFAAGDFNAPQTLEELMAHNDLELYDLQTDPNEMRNLAYEAAYQDTLVEMNALLNRLIAQEIGVDDGREFTDLLPILATLSQ